MKKLLAKIRMSKFVNSGIVKKVKDYIYFNWLEPHNEGKTDKYRTKIIADFNDVFGTEWMLAFGSILFYTRDHTMNGQDLDIIVAKEALDKHLSELIERGYQYKQLFYNCLGTLTEYKLLYEDVEVDVFVGFRYKNICNYYFSSRNRCV